MARYNRTKKAPVTDTVNQAGGRAFTQSTELELVSILLTSFMDNKFHESGNETQARLVNCINGIKNKEFAAKAAIYARDEFGMRSVSHVAAAAITNIVSGEKWVRPFLKNVVIRVDDITEIAAFYMSNYGTMPSRLKRGLGDALGKFNEYQIAKYKGGTHEVKLIDVVNLIHPTPTEKNSNALKALVSGDLKAFDTWESMLSAAGQDALNEEDKGVLKAEAWASLLKEKKLGYFAALRNIRNIMTQAPQLESTLCEVLINEEMIKGSRVLPFRFQTAMKEVGSLSRGIKMALNKAIDISLSNVPRMEGKTAIVLDVSGSMQSGARAISPAEIGALFAAALYKTNDADVILFEGTARYLTKLNPADSLMTLTDQIKFPGGSTNLSSAFQIMDKKYDRIIILSDMQTWEDGGSGGLRKRIWENYKSKFDANPQVFSWDLQGYGNMQFPETKVACLAGFSDKSFELMKLLETDKKALIHKIEEIEII